MHGDKFVTHHDATLQHPSDRHAVVADTAHCRICVSRRAVWGSGGDEQLPVAGDLPYLDDGQRGGLGVAVLEEEAASAVPDDECWIAMWPEHPDVASLVRSTLRGNRDRHGTQPVVGQVKMSHGAQLMVTIDSWIASCDSRRAQRH